MTFKLHKWLWTPQRKLTLDIIGAIEQKIDVCAYSPTGGGKTTVASEVMRWVTSENRTGIFYVNRSLLIPQTLGSFKKNGLDVGIRAAGYDDEFCNISPIQIASAQSEYKRTFTDTGKYKWTPFDADVVVIDEAHLQKGKTMQEIIADHKSRGSVIVLLTATPIGVSRMADKLLIPGTMQDYMDCKALVPATVIGGSQMDMGRVERNVTGEYVMDGKLKRVYTQSIIGDVLELYKKWNKADEPTMGYWPCVASSVWGTEQFTNLGVPFCHVDAQWAQMPHENPDGSYTLKRYSLTPKLWREISEMFRDGKIKGINSRFKTREGIDFPFVRNCLLACPIGSLASYIQTVGRVLRHSPATPDSVLVFDHGGNYWRHNSPTIDRPWERYFNMTERAVSTDIEKQRKEGKEKEPIKCSECGTERMSGFTCPSCGHVHAKSRRKVTMLDGNMKIIDGPLVKVKPTVKSTYGVLASEWGRLFWAMRKSGKAITLRQVAGIFRRKYGQLPPQGTTPWTPKHKSGWDEYAFAISPHNLLKPAEIVK